MANSFFDAFQNQPPQQNMMDSFNEFRSNPNQFLADKGINVPKEYSNSPEQTARYLLSNMPQVQQNRVMQTVNMLKGMFDVR